MSNELKDLRKLNWTRHSKITGSYLKATDIEDGVTVYYKLSAFNIVDGVYGHESVNEIIVNRFCALLGFEHLKYNLIHAIILVEGKEYTTWLVKSHDFKKSSERKLTFEAFAIMNGCSNDRLELFNFVDTLNFRNDIYKMMLLYYIVYNRDRHGTNIEVLYNSNAGAYRLAPIFDNGLSLMATCLNDVNKVKNYNIMNDSPVNNFIGSMIPSECLRLLKGKIRVPIIDLNQLDLSDLSQHFIEHGGIYVNQIKDMIEKRYEYAVQILNT